MTHIGSSSSAPPAVRWLNASQRQSPPPFWSSAPGPVADSPTRVGKPLFGPLERCHGARRGTYRVVYRIDEENRRVLVLDIAHRRDIYGHL